MFLTSSAAPDGADHLINGFSINISSLTGRKLRVPDHLFIALDVIRLDVEPHH